MISRPFIVHCGANLTHPVPPTDNLASFHPFAILLPLSSSRSFLPSFCHPPPSHSSHPSAILFPTILLVFLFHTDTGR